MKHNEEQKPQNTDTNEHDAHCFCQKCQEEDNAFWRNEIMPILFPNGLSEQGPRFEDIWEGWEYLTF